MIELTRLLNGKITYGSGLRYDRGAPQERKPIVVWNTTRQCNLKCMHCYIKAQAHPQKGELTTDEAKRFIKDLADYKVPVILFSGGEPLMRGDLFQLAEYAIGLGLRAVISTNGTLIDEKAAEKIKGIGFTYVGISLDGGRSTNDKFRGQKGAFDKALHAIRILKETGVKVGLRFTINKHNYKDLPEIFDVIEKEGIPRVCFYHLVYAGRGSDMVKDDLTNTQQREALEYIINKVIDFQKRRIDIELLTVDNHADGIYLYLKLKKEGSEKADEVYRLLKANGGNASGVGIACVDNLGFVHADQFWQHYSFGNVKERPFGEIWSDTSDPVMKALKNRKGLINGKCSQCAFFDLCNGNLRVRAEAYYGDLWQEDPQCFLTKEEVAK